MSSVLIYNQSQSIPGVLVNNHARIFDILNSAALRARYENKDIKAYNDSLDLKNYEYRKKLLSSRLSSNDTHEKSTDLLLQFTLIAKKKNKSGYNNYMSPMEERRNHLEKHFKRLYRQIKKENGMEKYLKKLLPKMANIQEDQKNIQISLKKYRTIIFTKRNKNNLFQQNNSSKLPSLRLSSFNNKNNNSFSERRSSNLSLSKINKSYVEEDKSHTIIKDNNTINTIDKSNNNNVNQIQNRNNIKIYKIKKVGIKKGKNSKSNKISDINLKPRTNSPPFQLFSPKANFPFLSNSLLRGKKIKNYLPPFESDQISQLFKYIKKEQGKIK